MKINSKFFCIWLLPKMHSIMLLTLPSKNHVPINTWIKILHIRPSRHWNKIQFQTSNWNEFWDHALISWFVFHGRLWIVGLKYLVSEMSDKLTIFVTLVVIELLLYPRFELITSQISLYIGYPIDFDIILHGLHAIVIKYCTIVHLDRALHSVNRVHFVATLLFCY